MGAALENGSSVAIVGGGPAGSLCAYFLRTFAGRMDLDLGVDIYEPRDFARAGPAGCNMCGGVVSESLVQALAVEGIDLPATIVQRGIDSYVLHTDTESLRIETPLHEKRIAAVHRGGGPQGTPERRWGGLDGHLLSLARNVGARVIPARVTDLAWRDGRPEVRTEKTSQLYDLLVGATGVNSPGLQLFEKLGLPSKPCQTTRAYITEIGLGKEAVTGQFGGAVHMFLLNVPRLDCAAIIPKGSYLTVCLLGRHIDRELIDTFFRSPAVQRCFPDGWSAAADSCHCTPRINVREASTPFLDRVVLIGDCGATRLYKDGIGAAYRTAKAAAKAAVFSGVSCADFRRHYWPVYRTIARDNRFGRVIFGIVRRIKAFPPFLRALMRISGAEQETPGESRRMSIVLWDMFTGSAPYRETFLRTLDPRFLATFLWKSLGSLKPSSTRKKERRTTEGVLGRAYRDGEVICRQGEVGDRMYVIQSGDAVVSREQDGVEEVVGVLGPGEVFGEMSIVEREPRSATVRARGVIRVLTLDRSAFLRQVHEDPSFAYRILQQMSRRTRSLDTTVSQLLLHARPRSERTAESSEKPPSG